MQFISMLITCMPFDGQMCDFSVGGYHQLRLHEEALPCHRGCDLHTHMPLIAIPESLDFQNTRDIAGDRMCWVEVGIQISSCRVGNIIMAC